MKNLCCLLVLLLAGLSACRNEGKGVARTEPDLLLTDSLRRLISLDTVALSDFRQELLLNGRVTFDQEQVTPVYIALGGNVTSVRAGLGDWVPKGSLLAEIRSSEAAEYDMQQKQAVERLRVARRSLDAAQELYVSGLNSQPELAQAEQGVKDAESEKTRIERQLDIFQIAEGAVYQMKAPVSGYVVDKKINPNMQIRTDHSEAVFTLSGLEDVWVIAGVYESDISKITEGASVRMVSMAYPDGRFEGKIDRIYQVLDDQSKTMSVRIKVKNEQLLLKPGMFISVYASYRVGDEKRLTIGKQALIFDNETYSVVVKDEKNRLMIRPVEVERVNGLHAYLKSGLSEGEVVVVRNAILVYNALKSK